MNNKSTKKNTETSEKLFLIRLVMSSDLSVNTYGIYNGDIRKFHYQLDDLDTGFLDNLLGVKEVNEVTITNDQQFSIKPVYRLTGSMLLINKMDIRIIEIFPEEEFELCSSVPPTIH